MGPTFCSKFVLDLDLVRIYKVIYQSRLCSGLGVAAHGGPAHRQPTRHATFKPMRTDMFQSNPFFTSDSHTQTW